MSLVFKSSACRRQRSPGPISQRDEQSWWLSQSIHCSDIARPRLCVTPVWDADRWERCSAAWTQLCALPSSGLWESVCFLLPWAVRVCVCVWRRSPVASRVLMYLPDFRLRPIYKQQSAAYKVVMVQAPTLVPLCLGLAFCISKYETQCKTLPLAIIVIHLVSTHSVWWLSLKVFWTYSKLPRATQLKCHFSHTIRLEPHLADSCLLFLHFKKDWLILAFFHDLCALSELLLSTKLAKSFAKPRRRKTWCDSLNKKQRPSHCHLMLAE